MKILIIGGGQDGVILSYLISKNYNLEGLMVLRNKSKRTNYYLPVREIGSFIEKENYLKLEKIIEEFEPTHIINTVALSSTAQCNQFRELALEINANFVKKLATFLKDKKLNFIHLGSILEKENRPNCIYTISKVMASKFIAETNNLNAFTFRLPNHESPLRDDRFFIREIIDIFQKNLDSNKNFTIHLMNGKTKRDWSWAPSLLNKIMHMILEDNYNNNFKDLTCSLSLIEFTICIANIFNLKEVEVVCAKSGTYNSNDFIMPEIPKATENWIKKLIIVKNNEIFNLENWC